MARRRTVVSQRGGRNRPGRDEADAEYEEEEDGHEHPGVNQPRSSDA